MVKSLTNRFRAISALNSADKEKANSDLLKVIWMTFPPLVKYGVTDLKLLAEG
jgi:hypothetical protein